MRPASPELWAAVDRMVDRAPGLADLRAHRLHLIGAARRRADADLALRSQLRSAAVSSLLAPVVLTRARAAYDGALMLFKGPEAGARYPDPALRPFRDLDLLADDAPAAQRALLAAGFQPLGPNDAYYADRHHLRPLVWPGTPMVIEVHTRPEWPKWSSPPGRGELLEAAVPSALAVDGLLAPAPAHHALLIAAHSWSETPLRLLLDLVDIAALTDGLDPRETAAVARRWGIASAWGTLSGAADSLLRGAPPTLPLRTWGRSVAQSRDRTVLERHAADLLGAFWAAPLPHTPRVAAMALARALRPAKGETASAKLARTGRALRNATAPQAGHHAAERPVHLPVQPATSTGGGFPLSGLQATRRARLGSQPAETKEREKRL